MNLKLFNNIVMAFLFISPITYIYGETYEEYKGRQHYLEQQRQFNEAREHNLEQMRQNDLRNKVIQTKNDENLEYERQNRAYKQKLNTARKPELPTQQKIDKLADLMSSDEAQNAVNYIDNLQPDSYQPRQVERVEMNGFDNNLYDQRDNEVKYKYGNGGGVNEKELFPLNLPRQQ